MSTRSRSLVEFIFALKDALFESLSTTVVSWVVVRAILWSLTPSHSPSSADRLIASSLLPSYSGVDKAYHLMTTTTMSFPEEELDGGMITPIGFDLMPPWMILQGGMSPPPLPPLQSYILILLIQALWTALLLRAFLLSRTATSSFDKDVVNIVTLDGLYSWLPIGVSFIAMMLTSTIACSHSSIPATLLFGNIGPIISFAVDYQLWGLSMNQGGVASSPEDCESRMKNCNGSVALISVTMMTAVFISWRMIHHNDYASFMILMLAAGFQIIYAVKTKSKMDTAIHGGTLITGATMTVYNTLMAVPVLMVVVANCHHRAAIMNGVLMVLVAMVLESGILGTIWKAVGNSTTSDANRYEDSGDEDELSVIYLRELSSCILHKVGVAAGTLFGVVLLSWAMPPVYLLSLFQAMAILLIMATWFVSQQEGDRLSLRQFKQCAGFALFVTATMLMSVLAYSHSVVFALLIFRNVDFIRTMAVEYEIDIRKQHPHQQHHPTLFSFVRSPPTAPRSLSAAACIIITAVVTLFSNWTISSLNDLRIGFTILAIVAPILYGSILSQMVWSVQRSGGVGGHSSFYAASLSSYDILLGVPILMALVCILDKDKFSVEGAMVVLITLYGEPTPTSLRRGGDFIISKWKNIQRRRSRAQVTATGRRAKYITS